ncbi:hypothetical protein ASZ90_004549 [hydrocarbon metagenome]|uniref:Uncharacterized protein n=1 Tax=hydrocarbon metagenome TaxID=938273 RepID=A0A0W8FXN0_9ZZZZ
MLCADIINWNDKRQIRSINFFIFTSSINLSITVVAAMIDTFAHKNKSIKFAISVILIKT